MKGSPLYIKYQGYQAEQPTAVVCIRLGGFYEVFGDNAVTIANELDLTLTGRDCGLPERVPMIGFPYHVSEVYFGKIAKKHDLYIVENDNDKQFIEQVKIGSWITLSEWGIVNDEYIPINVVTKKIDGNEIKEDTFYKIENGKFVEV